MQVTELEKMSEDLEKDHSQLKQKIERKAADLDRAEKRYRTLKKVIDLYLPCLCVLLAFLVLFKLS